MSLFRIAATAAAGAAKSATKAGAAALKATGGALHGSAKYVSDHEQDITGATRRILETGAKAVEKTGEALASRAGAFSAKMDAADPADNAQAAHILKNAVGYTAQAVGAIGKLTGRLGALTQRASPAISGATGSAISGVLGTVSGAVDSIAITEGDFDALHERLRTASEAVRSDVERRNALIARAQRERSKQDLLDLLVIGGVTLSTVALDPSQTPIDVERAFALAYPGLASGGESFAEAVQRIPAEDLVGLVSGVKGKLFEVALVEDLNQGGLPDGLHAELAGSATQPGYDIRIFDDAGGTVDLLQAKATESAAYVQQALERYPDIDVTTTAEVYAQLGALGALDRVSDSGISEQVLQATVEGAIAGDDHLNAVNVVPSSVGLAIIALSSFKDESLPLEARGAQFGDRAAKAGVAGIAAQAALVTTSMWWLALAAGVGSRWLTSYGGNKRQRYEALEKAVKFLERKAQMPAARPSAAGLTAISLLRPT